jgi:phosphoadenosine phosphosulfate reductase
MILVIGLDAATWKVINPNLEELPNLKGLIGEGKHKTITLNERPHSASVWCSIFSGKSPEEHGHKDFVVEGKLQTREDIKVKFIWDVLDEIADIRALNIAFVYPPYNHKCSYKAIGYGLSTDFEELQQDLDNLTEKAKEVLRERPDVFIVVYTMLDKISHFHWGTPMLLEWYRKVDAKLGELLNQVNEEDKLIVISDHGFCDWDEVEEHTLPKSTPEGEIKGDHHREAILITKNVSSPINSPQDVFYAIREELYSTMDEKITHSKKVISRALEKYSKPVIAYTGGKDSTLMLWLIREVCREKGMAVPPLMFINEGDVFREIYDFVKRIAHDWNLELIEVKNEDVLKQVSKVGDMVYVDKLNETNKCELERLGFRGESFVFEPESMVGNHLMKTVAMNSFISENSIEAVFTGIRWDEQDARKDELYFSPRNDPRHIRVHPILHFRERDVWQAVKKYGIPYNELYAQGYRSLGAKRTTAKVSDAPAWEQDLESVPERTGRAQDKENIMKRLRDLGYM